MRYRALRGPTKHARLAGKLHGTPVNLERHPKTSIARSAILEYVRGIDCRLEHFSCNKVRIGLLLFRPMTRMMKSIFFALLAALWRGKWIISFFRHHFHSARRV